MKRSPFTFLILGQQRSGTTALCWYLDSHPDIGCPRDEPFHRNSPYAAVQKADALAILWGRSGYKAAGFKLMPSQFGAFPWRRAENVSLIITLTHENPVACGVSMAVKRERGYSHHEDDTPDTRYTLRPDEVTRAVKEAMLIERHVTQRAAHFGTVIHLKNTDVDQWPTHKRLQRLMGVDVRRLETRLVKTTAHRPLPDVVKNWPDVRAALWTQTDWRERIRKAENA